VSNRDGARDVYQQMINAGMHAIGTPVRLSTGTNAITVSLSADGTRLLYGVLTMWSNVWSAPITSDGHRRTPHSKR
jgi:hypothetical protein